MPLKTRNIKTLLSTNLHAIITFLALIIVILINIFINNIHIVTIGCLISAAASGHLLMLISLKRIQKIDHIAEDSIIVFFAFFVAYVFFQKAHPLIKFAFCTIVLLVYRLTICALNLKDRKNIPMSVAAFIAILFLIYRFNILADDVQSIVVGAFRASVFHFLMPLIALIILAIFYYCFYLFNREMMLFVLGKEYFETTNYLYWPIYFVREIIKVALLAFAIFCAGVYAIIGFRFTFPTKNKNIFDYTNAIHMALAIQICASIENLLNAPRTIAIALILSLLFPKIIRRLYKYD
ncbi:MAG: hypothetical protein N2316_09525 [Spirochaetes bacterium]|nr:hypothetical protein [Spirochaetota bacterium]